MAVYDGAFGGLFALAFALAHGRMGAFGPRTTSALLALSGIVAITIVPNLKYPANPPSVGDPETIGMRTGLYFSMIAISLAAMIAAWMARNRLLRPYGEWNAALIAGAAYLIAVVLVAVALPTVNEVPEEFPAVALWQFRMASLGSSAWRSARGWSARRQAGAARGSKRLRVDGRAGLRSSASLDSASSSANAGSSQSGGTRTYAAGCCGSAPGSGRPRAGTGVDCTMLVVVWPWARNWSRISSSWSRLGRWTFITKQSSPVTR